MDLDIYDFEQTIRLERSFKPRFEWEWTEAQKPALLWNKKEIYWFWQEKYIVSVFQMFINVVII